MHSITDPAPSRRPWLGLAIISSTGVVVLAALGNLAYFETATVKLSVPTQRLDANVTFSAGESGQELIAHRIDASVTESQVGTASVVQVASTYATGEVLFKWRCDIAPCWTPVDLPAGTAVSTAGGKHYLTQASTAFVAPNQDRIVPVRAAQPGAGGNTGPDTIIFVIDESNKYGVQLHVSNPAAITGGSDAHTSDVVQQPDFDAVHAVLAAKVTDELTLAFKAEAAGMTFVPVGPPTLTWTSDYHVGDATPTFTLTVTATQSATAFYQSDALALLRSALVKEVPEGYQLTSDPLETSYQIAKVSSNGDLTISGSASGFIAQKVDTEKLRGQTNHMSVSDARALLLRAVPGSHVDIHVGPVPLPWMPLTEQRISMTVVVSPRTK